MDYKYVVQFSDGTFFASPLFQGIYKTNELKYASKFAMDWMAVKAVYNSPLATEKSYTVRKVRTTYELVD